MNTAKNLGMHSTNTSASISYIREMWRNIKALLLVGCLQMDTTFSKFKRNAIRKYVGLILILNKQSNTIKRISNLYGGFTNSFGLVKNLIYGQSYYTTCYIALDKVLP